MEESKDLETPPAMSVDTTQVVAAETPVQDQYASKSESKTNFADYWVLYLLARL